MNDKPTRITVRVRPHFARKEQDLMNAISIILNPLPGLGAHPLTRAIRKDSGMAWQLDDSNDWWADLKGCELTIATRYEPYKLEALASYIRFFLG